MARVINDPTRRDPVKDAYFFIDYLRLHRYGRSNNIWKKNRNMLVKEHEYDRSQETRARKGYKSYIQRCFKSILDVMYSDFQIIKPRNVFGYEIGKKNDSSRSGDIDLETTEGQIQYTLSRYLVNNKYTDQVRAYRDAVLAAPGITFKNREAGLVVRLDNNKSYGYRALKHLERIRTTQDNLVAAIESQEDILKDLIAGCLKKAVVYKKDESVNIVDGRHEGNSGIIRDDITTDHQGTISRNYTIVTPEGRTYNASANELAFADSEVAEVPVPDSPLISQVVEYANDNLRDANLDALGMFNLARGAVVRELIANGDIDSASALRNAEITSEILNSIQSRVHVPNDDYEDIGGDEIDDFLEDIA